MSGWGWNAPYGYGGPGPGFGPRGPPMFPPGGPGPYGWGSYGQGPPRPIMGCGGPPGGPPGGPTGAFNNSEESSEPGVPGEDPPLPPGEEQENGAKSEEGEGAGPAGMKQWPPPLMGSGPINYGGPINAPPGFNPFPSSVMNQPMPGTGKKAKKKAAKRAAAAAAAAQAAATNSTSNNIPPPQGQPGNSHASYASVAANSNGATGPPPTQPSFRNSNIATQSDNWPESLKQYVSKCFAKCATEMDKDQVEIILKGKITKAASDGVLHSKDWEAEPLPSTLSIDMRPKTSFALKPMGAQARLASLGRGRGFGSISKYQRSDSPPSRRRRRDSSDSSESSNGRRISPDYGKNANCIPLGAPKRGRGGIKSTRLGLTTQKKRLKTHNDDNCDDVPYFYTDGSKKMTLDADLATMEQRQKRARRFANPAERRSSHPRSKPLDIMSTINSQLSGDQFEESNIPWEGMHVVGTCQDLEKRYFRLTAAPEPHMVRPVPVLQQSLDMVMKKWKANQDYHYACNQLKSIRQDLTVQGIRDEFTVKVYETHARIALEKVDFTEFNQCQSQLKVLYHDVGGKNRLEFTAYRMLYYMYTKETLDLTSVLAELTEEEKTDECVAHALKLRTAWSLQNYSRFFKLYASAPKMSGFLIDWFVARERKAALRTMIKAYKPGTIPVAYIIDILAFETSKEWNEFIEPFGLSFFDPEKTKLDCKASAASLATLA